MRHLAVVGLLISIVVTAYMPLQLPPGQNNSLFPLGVADQQQLSPQAFLPLVASNWSVLQILPPQTTGQNGEAVFHLPQMEVRVQTKDQQSGQPLSDIDVQLAVMQEGVLAFAVDPDGEYFPNFSGVSLSSQSASMEPMQMQLLVPIGLIAVPAAGYAITQLSSATASLLNGLLASSPSLDPRQWSFDDMLEEAANYYMLVYFARDGVMYMRAQAEKVNRLLSCGDWRRWGLPNPFYVRPVDLPFEDDEIANFLYQIFDAVQEQVDPCISTIRISLASDGTQANGESFHSSVSRDCRYIAFTSVASNLVSDDTNGVSDVFVYDRQTHNVARVSIASDGGQGNKGSSSPSISEDGRYVAFSSSATNLVSGDTNSQSDIFVHDRQTHTTMRVSVASDGTQGNGESGWPYISADGRYIAFESLASNLVGGDTNGARDVFVHDLQTHTTTRVSVASNGGQGNDWSRHPSISDDGRYVAFYSNASNLVSGDTNGIYDVFVHDRQTNITVRISVASNGTQGNGGSGAMSISADGRYITFDSWASNLVNGDTNGESDVFLHDRQMCTTIRISVASNGVQGNDHSSWPIISADGSCVAFESWANNLVSNDTNGARDVFIRGR